MIHVVAGTIGAVMVLMTWLSGLRTVFVPRGRTSRAAWWTPRVVARCCIRLASQLPQRARNRILDQHTSLSLIVMGTWWLLSLSVGFSMLAWSIYDVPFQACVMAGFLLTGSETLLTAVARTSIALLFVVVVVYLAQLSNAHCRRERIVAQLSYSALRPLDAESMVSGYLISGSRDLLDSTFGTWMDWLTDLRCTHIAYPTLVYARSTGELCWLRATVIILDVAALIEAVAPTWAPPRTKPLLTSGIRCLNDLSSKFGVVPVAAAVSLQGREERCFAETMRMAVNAGLPAERNEESARAVFQELRSQYAPHASAIGTTLLSYHDFEYCETTSSHKNDCGWES